ncbi:MAG: phosphoribosyltransferase [Candidatus Sungbacteria bacterium]|nr:phosphoribosyltransferase [Candidatus Sungbacteria bacterium]
MKYFYTWQELDKDIEKISKWAKDKNFKSIYGIPRGGLVVAVALSHRLNLPLKLHTEEIDSLTLVVDDISDSGKTLLDFEKNMNMKPAVATLFYHKDTKRMPDFFLREKKDWVVFPWEIEESSKYDHHNF